MIASPSRRLRRSVLACAASAAVAAAATALAVQAQAAVANHSPYGQITAVTQVGARQYTLTGWAQDDDTSKPIRVVGRVDGVRQPASKVTANLPTPAVPSRYPNHTAPRGFTTRVTVPLGTHQLCMVAINVGPGTDSRFGCQNVTVRNNPVGRLFPMHQVPGHLRVSGNAYDPNSTTPVQVRITAKPSTAKAGAPATLLGTASADKMDSKQHFGVNYVLADGTYKVCATALNIGWGSNTSLGCESITLDFDPVGDVYSVTQVAGGFRVVGWARDPDTTAPIRVATIVDGHRVGTTLANGTGGAVAGHHYVASYLVDAGKHRICVTGWNVGPGQTGRLGCRTMTLDYDPTVTLRTPTQTLTGLKLSGTAVDPDRPTAGLTVWVYLDGTKVDTVASSATTNDFAAALPAGAGLHTICAVARNIAYGTNNTRRCTQISLNFNPAGSYASISRVSAGDHDLTVSGWAIDRGTHSPVRIQAALDGTTTGSPVTAKLATKLPAPYRSWGSDHGFSFTVPTGAGEHTVCLTALNIGSGQNTSLGCKLIIAVHPKPASAPQAVAAQGGYGGATISWTPPASDGGAPPTSYVVSTLHGLYKTTVPATAATATVTGLRPSARYRFIVAAVNVAGASPVATTPAITTQASPPPQTSPAPISTSRYIRNISNASPAQQSMMRSEGTFDAKHNPSGHGYLILLDIGGQDQYDHGVVLSAGVRFVSYSNLVTDLKAYVAGYASAQKPSAPITIALGTNNDMDVTGPAGATWANTVVDPVAAYAKQFPGVTIAGANDIEPGFSGTYRQTGKWLSGYLNATKAPFVFNGSADGCSWTTAGKGCNNGWTMQGLYQLAAGAAPIRIINLPQIYNNTMAQQWKYISLTGVAQSQPRIDFGGALTEWTACDQAGSCSSLTGNAAWRQLWNQLQSVKPLKVNSLPYSTDLRIDK